VVDWRASGADGDKDASTAKEGVQMKILFISDIHGVPSALEAALARGDALGYDRLVLLGDLLYHGPRNGVPRFYDTAVVVKILNARKDKILAVRGNCDSEVDQALLEFPMMADYAELDADGERFFLTHGHLWNEYRLPPIGTGTILAHGHTHIAETKRLECGVTIFNPGSVGLPRGGQGCTFGYWDGSDLFHYTFSVASDGGENHHGG
jgi:hypothetical protein